MNNTFDLWSWVAVNNKMQTDYYYKLSHKQGDMPANFAPIFTPGDMLRLGVFEGKYLCDCVAEYPAHMMYGARFSPAKPDPVRMNAFKAKSRNPMWLWQERGWIHPQDPRGWFEWYCRFWLGRRSADDQRQIDRWARFAARHTGALLHFGEGDITKRKATRQALLQWAHDPLPDIPCMGDETIGEKTYRILRLKRIPDFYNGY